MKKIAIALTALMLTAGCGSDETPSAAKTKAPTLKAGASVITVNPSAELGTKIDCNALPGDFAALKTGAQIVVRNSVNEVVATASLKPIQNINDAGKLCTWTADFSGIPVGGKFYVSSIGKWKSAQVSEAALKTTKLTITATN